MKVETNVNQLPAGFSALLTSAFWIVIAAATILLLIFVASRLNRRRLIRRAREATPTETARNLQGLLIDAIKSKSSNQRTEVLVTPFWKGRRISPSVRSALIEELIDAGIVTAARKTYTNEFTKFFADAWFDFFCIPPSKLTLSDQDWLLMVNSKMTGQGIVIERLVMTVGSHNSSHTINSGGGAVTGVAQGGRDAKVNIRDISADNLPADLDSLHALLRALRADEELAVDPHVSARIRTHADLLEQDIEEPESSETRENLLDRITGLINKYGEAMTTTINVVGAMAQSSASFAKD